MSEYPDLGKSEYSELVEKIAQPIPDCHLIEIPDASHDLPNENPQEFIRIRRAYLLEAK